MNDHSSQTSSGIGFFSLLTIVFIVLKLCNVIAWSWVWVLAPIWIPTAIIIIAILIYLICVMINTAIKNKKKGKKWLD